MDKKKALVFCSIILIIILSLALIFYLGKFETAVDVANQNRLDYKKIEKSFLTEPNIDSGIILIEKYYLETKYDEALNYAQKCVQLGVNETPLGYLVNFQMAVIYNKVKNIEKASFHLNTAVRLDKKGIILDNNWIQRERLSHLKNPD